MRRPIAWVVLALAGLVIAAGAGYAASRLAVQPVGLSSEPISAGRALAPREVPARRRAAPRRTVTATVTAVPTPKHDDGDGDADDD